MKITAQTNGPLLVEGPADLVDQSGVPYRVENPAKFALCRCGSSANKPFCDGTHTRVGFRSAPQPVAARLSNEDAQANWESEGGRVTAARSPLHRR